MEDLITRLRAAIDETEQGAANCQEQHWRPDGYTSQEVYVLHEDGSNRTIARCWNGYDLDDFANSLHIARHDPASVLRMVAAHRKILDDCATTYRAKLDDKPEDEADMWHRTGQGSVWFRVITALAEGYGIEP